MHAHRMHTDNIGRQHRSNDGGSEDSAAWTSSGRTTCHYARRRRTFGPEVSLCPFPMVTLRASLRLNGVSLLFFCAEGFADKMTSMVGSQPRTLANHPCELADIPGRPARANSVSFAHELPECLCLLQGAGERSLLRATWRPETWCCGVSAWGQVFVSNTSSTGVSNVSVTSSRTGNSTAFSACLARAKRLGSSQTSACCRSQPLPAACDKCQCAWTCQECRESPAFLWRHAVMCKGLQVARKQKNLKTEQRRMLRLLLTIVSTHAYESQFVVDGGDDVRALCPDAVDERCSSGNEDTIGVTGRAGATRHPCFIQDFLCMQAHTPGAKDAKMFAGVATLALSVLEADVVSQLERLASRLGYAKAHALLVLLLVILLPVCVPIVSLDSSRICPHRHLPKIQGGLAGARPCECLQSIQCKR